MREAASNVQFQLPKDKNDNNICFISAKYSINDDDWNLIWYNKDDLARIQEENTKIHSGEIQECRLGLEPSCAYRCINVTKSVLAEQQRQKQEGIQDDEALSAASVKITRAARITAISTANNLQGEVRIYQMNRDQHRQDSKRKKFVNTSERDEDYTDGTTTTMMTRKQKSKKKIKRKSRRTTFGGIADKFKRTSRTVDSSLKEDNYGDDDDDEKNVFIRATKEEKRKSRKSLGDYLRGKLSSRRVAQD